MHDHPAWNEPTEGQLDYLDETFTLTEMLAHFKRQWNDGNEGFWRVWGNTCEETLLELADLRREVAELRSGVTKREAIVIGT